MIHRYAAFKAAISSIYKSIQKIERQEMEHFGLKGPHVQCLLAVYAHPEGIAAARLCELCDRDKASISRSLTELEHQGLLNREPGYRASLHLTERGCTVAEQIRQRADRAVQAVSLAFGDEDRRAFYEDLDEIAARLQNICEEGVSQQ